MRHPVLKTSFPLLPPLARSAELVRMNICKQSHSYATFYRTNVRAKMTLTLDRTAAYSCSVISILGGSLASIPGSARISASASAALPAASRPTWAVPRGTTSISGGSTPGLPKGGDARRIGRAHRASVSTAASSWWVAVTCRREDCQSRTVSQDQTFANNINVLSFLWLGSTTQWDQVVIFFGCSYKSRCLDLTSA